MCGLAGRFHADRLPPAPGWVHRAGELLAHRGPDGSGCWRDASCELVHRRLALLDLSPAGRQPLANETGDVHVVFNGEIYNHTDLRAALLARGHTFKSRTDTEVLVHLYEERGDRLVDDLRGMFAFAIYDVRRRRLLLARDRFGVKPLFYAFSAGQLVFASEIKAIAALPGFHPELDRQACADFLGLGYVPEPATGFANVHALLPGTILTADGAGHRLQSYHAVSVRPDPARGLRETADVARNKLTTAVARQSRADVPVAALLSGGIDSSLIVAAQRHADAASPRPATFNVRFPPPSADDTPLAVAVSRRYGTRHRTIEHRSWTLGADALRALLLHFDQPFADTGCIPLFWVARAIRERGIRCALSGDGGDEVFGGYDRFWRAGLLMRLMRLPGWARRVTRQIGGALTTWTKRLGRRLAKASLLADAGRSDSSVMLAGLANYLGEEEKRALLLPTAAAALLPVARHFDGFRPAAALDLDDLSRRMTEKMLAVSLPSAMLRKVDMMTMRAGIEVRVPLLDEDVVELGLSLPHRLKTDGRQGKIVLRNIAKDWLPPEVVTHPKQGFHLPLEVLATPDTATMCEELLLGGDARVGWFLNRALMRHWLERFRGAAAGQSRVGPTGAMSRAGLAHRVVTLLSLELWMREYGLSW